MGIRKSKGDDAKMTEMIWYESESGRMVQGQVGLYAIDSRDGPLIEQGYHTTGYDGAGYPI